MGRKSSLPPFVRKLSLSLSLGSVQTLRTKEEEGDDVLLLIDDTSPAGIVTTLPPRRRQASTDVALVRCRRHH